MKMYEDAVAYLFSAVQVAIEKGIPPKEAWDNSVAETLQVFFGDAIREAERRNQRQKRLIEMTDEELAQACTEARVRLQLINEESADRKRNNDSGGTD